MMYCRKGAVVPVGFGEKSDVSRRVMKSRGDVGPGNWAESWKTVRRTKTGQVNKGLDFTVPHR